MSDITKLPKDFDTEQLIKELLEHLSKCNEPISQAVYKSRQATHAASTVQHDTEYKVFSKVSKLLEKVNHELNILKWQQDKILPWG